MVNEVKIAERWAKYHEGFLPEAHKGTNGEAVMIVTLIEELSVAEQQVAALREALEGAEKDFLDLNEYWNGANGSAADACYHTCEVTEQSLSAIHALLGQTQPNVKEPQVLVLRDALEAIQVPMSNGRYMDEKAMRKIARTAVAWRDRKEAE